MGIVHAPRLEPTRKHDRLESACVNFSPWTFCLGLVLVCAGCVGPVVVPAPDSTAASPVTVYLVRHDWHSDLIIPVAAIPPGLWPERADFTGDDYLVVGWGDRDYYRTPEPGLWMTLKAALLPTDSVLRIAGFQGPVGDHYPRPMIAGLELSRPAFDHLCRYIHDAFERDSDRVRPIPGGDHAAANFYPGRQSFHLLRTCNVWTASALRRAGFPVNRFSSLSSGLLFDALRAQDPDN